MGKWMRLAGGEFKNKSARGWSGYVKFRNTVTRRSSAVRAQNAKLAKAAQTCKGKNRADFIQCMRENM